MSYVAMIGLLFSPLMLLLLCAWNFVKYYAAVHENNDKEARSFKKRYVALLIGAAVCAVIFGVLHIIFPIPA